MFEVYGRYILLEKLNMGGMAEVFLAKKIGATGVEKFVAIKRILPDHSQTTEYIEMFKKEAEIAINLSHNNIVSVHEFGLEKNQFYLVMDYVAGRNLKQLLSQIRKSNIQLTTEQAIYVIKEVAAGLDYAHRAVDAKTGKLLEIIHRDISPQNVMISFEGEVRIVDFGIAKTDTHGDNTQAGTLKGKFSYMSPEQVDEIKLDTRTDIFSLGIVLWELLANDRLFSASNEYATIRKIRECKIPPLRQLNPQVNPELEKIVMKALARDRNVRYASGAALQKDLQIFLNKHYPTFTPQDFANFIKKHFNQEILENRKKQIEYSQVKLEDVRDESTNYVPKKKNASQEKSSKAAAESELAQRIREFENRQKQNQDTGKSKTAPSEIRELDENHFSREHENAAGDAIQAAVQAAQNQNINSAPHSNSYQFNKKQATNTTGQTTSYSRGTPVPHSDGIDLQKWSMPIFGLAIIGFVFFALSKSGKLEKISPFIANCMSQPKNCGKQNIEVASLPSVATQVAKKFQIYVNSNPSNAEIIINEKRIGKTTPDYIDVELSQIYKVQIKLPGYNKWEKTISADGPQSVTADLSRAKSANLIVVVQGRGDVFIDKKNVGKCETSNPCIVEPDKNLIIEVYDQLSQLYAQKNLSLSDGETKKIVLVPTKKAGLPQ